MRFVRAGYARRGELPSEETLGLGPGAPVFLTLVAAYQEPGIAATLARAPRPAVPAASAPATRSSRRRPRTRRRTRRCRPARGRSAGASSATCRPTMPSGSRTSSCPGPGARPSSSTGRSGPTALAQVLEGDVADPSRVFVGVFDADSIPDPDTLRWIAGEELAGRGALAYQGVTLSLANWDALGIRGRICAIQQSSIFTRVSLARLVSEIRAHPSDRSGDGPDPGRAGRWVRSALEFCFRRSQICLGHNQFVRLDVLQALGGFPTGGATEDSTLGYMLGARGILIRAMPMIELTDLPETKEKIVRQNARWYQGRARRHRLPVDDLADRAHGVQPRAARSPRRQQGGGVADRRVRLPGHGLSGLALRLRLPPGAAAPVLRGGGGADRVARAHHLGRRDRDAAGDPGDGAVPARGLLRSGWRSSGEWLLATFRCQTYWLLATRAAWRVLWRTARYGRYEPSKTDRVTRVAGGQGWLDRVVGGRLGR